MAVMGSTLGLSSVHNDLSLFPKWFNDYIVVGGRSSIEARLKPGSWIRRLTDDTVNERC